MGVLDIEALLSIVVTVAASLATTTIVSALLRRRATPPTPEGAPVQFSLWRFAAVAVPSIIVMELAIWFGLRYVFSWPMWLTQSLGLGISIGVVFPLAALVAQRPKR